MNAGALGSPGSRPRPSRHRRGTGLRRQLVTRALLAVALPVLLTGGLAAVMLGQHLDSMAPAAGPGGSRIVNASVEGDGPAGLTLRAGLGSQGDGFAEGAQISESFASAVDRLGPAEPVLREIAAMIPDPAVAFAGVEDALGDWRVQLALALVAIGILSAAFAAVLAVAAAGRYAEALGALTEMAERSARGEPVRMAPVETPREIVRLGDAVYRLGHLCNRVRDPRPVGSAHAR